MAASRTILCLPGTWSDRSELAAASAAVGLAAAGGFLVDTLLGTHVELELQPRDPRMRDAFAAAGAGEIDDKELDAIDEHRSVAYLLAEIGDLASLRRLIGVAVRLLPAGALGIKVESAGVAAPIERWMQLSVSLDPFGLIRCFVLNLRGEGHLHSCGMHNLGLPDVLLEGDDHRVLERFNLYQLVERPTLVDGQTFASDAGARAYKLRREARGKWPPDDPCFNPFGVWRLTAVAATKPAP